MDKELLTASEVAALLRVSRATVYRWANDGTLPCKRLGDTVRFESDEIAAAFSSAGPEVA